MYKPAHYDLFISYAANDADWVEGFFIPTLGLPAERIITRESFRPGADTVAEFERAIVNSRYTVLVLSPAFLADMWASYSESIASYLRVNHERDTLVPLLLKSCELSPRITSLKLSFDCTDKTQQNAELARLRDFLKQPEPPLQSLPCPYPGMRPFTERESHYFFGRDREVQELIERLASHPLVTIIGPSGSGKSSLVFAGLVPALEQGKFGHRPQEWSVYTMRPGETPLSELHRIFGHDGPHPEKTLTTTIAEQAGTRQALLVIDQFEELFTLAQAEALPFQETLQELITTSTCQIVITVRADFYQDLMTSLLWNHIQQCRQEILPLKTEGLRDAILKPAEQVGVFVETALVERLVADAANEPGVLPFIQETLALLWEGLERRFLPLYAYEALSAYGGEEQTGLQVAIARHADTVLAELSDEHHTIARRIFLRLVQFGEGRPDTRRQQSVKTLRSADDHWEAFDQTLEHFTRHRLVTQTGQEHEEGSRVDIAHDALIDGWPTLQQWIKERRKAEQLRRHLETKAAEWERLQRKGGLLDEIEVREAEEWLNSPEAKILGHSHALPELVKFSQQAITDELEEARKTARQLRKRFILAAIFAIGAIVAAIVAYYGFWQASRNEEIAQQERDSARRQSIEALNKTSRSLFLEHDELQALLVGVKSGIYAQQVSISTALEYQTILNLQEIVYGIHEKNRLEGHEAPVEKITFSPDGKFLASGGRDGVIRIWEMQNGGESITLNGHRASIKGINFSPDGKYLVACDESTTIKLWDISNQREIYTRQGTPPAPYESLQKCENTIGHCGDISDIAFGPDGKIFMSTGSRPAGIIWSVADGSEIRKFEGPNVIHGVSYRSDDNTKTSISSEMKSFSLTQQTFNALREKDIPDDILVKLRVLENQEFTSAKDFLDTLNSQIGEEQAVRYKTLILKHATGLIRASMSAHIPEEAEIRILEGPELIHGISFNPDGNIFISARSGEKSVTLWDFSSGRQITQLDTSSSSVTFSSDGKLIAVPGPNNTIKLWDVLSKKEIKTFHGDTSSNGRLAFSPDNSILASGCADNTIKLWNIATGRLITTLMGHSNYVRDISFSPDGAVLASGSVDKTIKLWNLGKSETPYILNGHSESVSSIKFSPDGAVLASGSQDSTVKLWDVSDGTQLKTLQENGDRVNGVSFSPDGKILASGTDHAVRLWDVENGSEITKLPVEDYIVTTIAFSPDSKMVALGMAAPRIRLWDIKNRDEVDELSEGMYKAITNVVFSYDGKLLASVGYHGVLDIADFPRIWNVSERKELIMLRENAISLAFSPDNAMLAIGTDNATLKLLSLPDFSEIRTILLPTGSARPVTFSPDSRILVSSNGKSITFWDIVNGIEISTLKISDTFVESLDFSPDGSLLASGDRQGTIRFCYLDLNTLIIDGCKQLHGYLTTNPNVSNEDRSLCNEIL